MRFFLIYPGHKIATIDIAIGYEQALRDLGHEVLAYNYHNSLTFYNHALDYWQKKNPAFTYDMEDWLRISSEQAVLEALRFARDGADFVVLAVCGFAFHREAFLMLAKALGLPVVLILTESPYADMRIGTTPGQIDMIQQSGIELAFTNERNSVRYLSENKTEVPIVYLPHSYDPERHNPQPPEDGYTSDVFFCGTRYQEREALFDGVDWTDIDARIIGAELVDREVKGGLDNAEVVKYYHGTKVALNIHRTTCGVFDERLVHVQDGQAWSLGPRAYEIAACGAFQISDDSRGELFDVFGDTVPTYRTAEECEALIRRYLADETARKELARQQHEAVEPCSFRARAEAILLPAIQAEVM